MSVTAYRAALLFDVSVAENKAVSMQRWLRLYWLVCALWLVGGCTPPEQHTFRLGANNWLGYQAFFEAQVLGYWPSSEIAVVELGSTTEVIRALSNGSIDAAALTLDEFVIARSRHHNLQAVMVIDISHGGDVLVVKPDIESLEALKGKTVAVENTALGAIMLDAVLNAAKLKAEEVTLYPVTYDQHETAFMDENVDALITFEPARSKLLAKGYKILFSSRDIPDTIVDVLVVSESTKETYRDRIKHLMAGFYFAQAKIEAGELQTVQHISKRTQIKRGAITLGYEQLRIPDLESNQSLMAQCHHGGLKETATSLMNIMLARRMISEAVDLTNMCDASLLQEITL